MLKGIFSLNVGTILTLGQEKLLEFAQVLLLIFSMVTMWMYSNSYNVVSFILKPQRKILRGH